MQNAKFIRKIVRSVVIACFCLILTKFSQGAFAEPIEQLDTTGRYETLVQSLHDELQTARGGTAATIGQLLAPMVALSNCVTPGVTFLECWTGKVQHLWLNCSSFSDGYKDQDSDYNQPNCRSQAEHSLRRVLEFEIAELNASLSNSEIFWADTIEEAQAEWKREVLNRCIVQDQMPSADIASEHCLITMIVKQIAVIENLRKLVHSSKVNVNE